MLQFFPSRASDFICFNSHSSKLYPVINFLCVPCISFRNTSILVFCFTIMTFKIHSTKYETTCQVSQCRESTRKKFTLFKKRSYVLSIVFLYCIQCCIYIFKSLNVYVIQGITCLNFFIQIIFGYIFNINKGCYSNTFTK